MARRCQIVKSQRERKYAVRKHNRCLRCFRPRAVYRRFGLCRLCFRELALRGEIPGVRKATW
uniref:Small ribosomal subunit protein uS14 n=1 Tax=candidate division WOR-3 bacterium TaxID=2052148 RepID=A0A7C4GHQ3_UNCW3